MREIKTRTIKFRAWDSADKMMYCNIHDGIRFDDGSCYSFDKFLRNSVGDPDMDDYHKWSVMQYTGLKDSRGVEIYEGDFVSHWHEEMFFQDNVVGLVVWQPDEACFEFEYSSTSQPFSNVDFNYIEPQIIGNIYENPELVDE